nr:P-loop NTPase fold protein [uncultured Deefgea sp.]
MTADLIDKSKFSSWKDSHQWDSCLLNREQYGKFLINYLIEEKSGYVLNIDSRWGSGKTEMLKRLYVEAMSRRHPCVFIDAWISDFSNAPLQVVSSELVTQLSELNEGTGAIYDKVKEGLGKLVKVAAIHSAGLIAKSLGGEASDGRDFAKDLLSKEPKDFLDALTDDYNDQISAIDSIKLELEALGQVLMQNFTCKLPIFIFIDELDRCRPNYAVELLESIKHFFNVPGFVFVIATDTTQITHAIKVIYGSGFDSETYLRRFFDRIASLPEPKISEYIYAKRKEKSEILKHFKMYPDDINHWIAQLAFVYELTLRDVDQLIARISSCLRTKKQETQEGYPINLISLISLLIEFSHHKDIYDARQRKHQSPDMSILDNKTIDKELASTIIEDALSCEEKKEFSNQHGHAFEKYPDEAYFYQKMNGDNNTGIYRALAIYSAQKNSNQIQFNTQGYRELVELSASLK